MCLAAFSVAHLRDCPQTQATIGWLRLPPGRFAFAHLLCAAKVHWIFSRFRSHIDSRSESFVFKNVFLSRTGASLFRSGFHTPSDDASVGGTPCVSLSHLLPPEFVDSLGES